MNAEHERSFKNAIPALPKVDITIVMSQAGTPAFPAKTSFSPQTLFPAGMANL